MSRQAKAVVDTKLHDDGAVSHKITFAGGETRTVLIKSNHSLAQQFIAHGSKAKILAAINSVDEEGKAISKVDELDEAFEAGRWSLQSEGTGKPRAGALVQALAALKGVSHDEAESYVKGLSRADQAKMRAHPAVAAKILEIEAAARTDGGADLLSDFLGEGTGTAKAA